MSYTEDKMTYSDLVAALDGLCWDARRYGHDDYGLEMGVDINGNDLDDSEEQYPDQYHPEAIALAKKLSAQFGLDQGDPF